MKELWLSTKNKELEKEAKFMNTILVKNNKVTLQGKEFTITEDQSKLDEGKIFRIEIKSKEDEEEAIKSGKKVEYLIVQGGKWKIIPLENLISKLKGKTKIIAQVKNVQEAKVALETLEMGVDGIFLETDNSKEFQELMGVLREIEGEQVTLEEAEVTKIKPLGMGARACLDTSDLMTPGEGALVGSSSQGMFLVQGEVEENPFVSSRPFRVNAGALSLYLLTPGNKTKYLEEMEAGSQILLVNKKGKGKVAFVCRSKIELRPMILIEARKEDKIAKVILQNAETVKLVKKEGSISVTELKEREKVLVHFQEGGRHFGTLVKEEQIIEK